MRGMDPLNWTLIIVLGILAILFSFFYGCYALEIFTDTREHIPTLAANGTLVNVPNPLVEKRQSLPWRCYQFLLNFVGSLIGWVAIGYIVLLRFHCATSCSNTHLDIADVVILLTGITGITGMLPYTISKLQSLLK
jgi:hypothetical protein